MNKEFLTFMILAILLVGGMFAFAGWNQVDYASAKLQTDVAMSRQPRVERTAASIGLTLIGKIIAGALVSLLVAAGGMAYQGARIRELKQGGWHYFLERRKVQKPPRERNRKPGLSDLLNLMIADRLNRK